MSIMEAITAQKEKVAYFLTDDLVGGAVGYHMGKEQKQRGESWGFGAPQVAGTLFIPGGAGYQVGRYLSHHNKNIKKGKTKKSEVDVSILSNEELLAMSTELAPEVVKVANGDMLDYFRTHPKKLKEKQERDVKKEKKAAPMGMLASGVGRMMAGAIKTPTMARAGIGMAAGAGAGAIRHMASGTNPQTGQKNTTLLGSMMGGAALGGAAGLGARQVAMRAGTMNNGVGQYARNAMAARGAVMGASGAGVTRSATAMGRIAQRGAAGRTATGGMKPGAPVNPAMMAKSASVARLLTGTV